MDWSVKIYDQDEHGTYAPDLIGEDADEGEFIEIVTLDNGKFNINRRGDGVKNKSRRTLILTEALSYVLNTPEPPTKAQIGEFMRALREHEERYTCNVIRNSGG